MANRAMNLADGLDFAYTLAKDTPINYDDWNFLISFSVDGWMDVPASVKVQIYTQAETNKEMAFS